LKFGGHLCQSLSPIEWPQWPDETNPELPSECSLSRVELGPPHQCRHSPEQ
jgi:hypothetical protein